jgi:putative intracellular protease/amidase
MSFTGQIKFIHEKRGLVMKKLLTAFAVLIALHPEYSGPSVDLPGKRALVITTSHSVLAAPGETEGKATGVFGSEMTHPYYTFLDGGMEVDIASIQGGELPIDPASFYFMVKTPEDDRYLNDPVAQAKVKNSIPIAEVDIDQYDIVFISGGWGAAYDLAQSPALAAKVSESYYGDKEAVIGGVCHGVLQELGIDLTPKHPETELRKAGAIFEGQTAFLDFFATHVTVDDERRFVTGQNQNSGLETAHTMMGILSERN